MTSRERVIKALEFESPDRAPRHLWQLPGVEMMRNDELEELRAKYPMDISQPPEIYGPSTRAKGQVAEVGTYTDEWGVEWTVFERGVTGEVRNPLFASWDALTDWTPPYERLDHADPDKINAWCKEQDTFILSSYPIRLFERLQFLRGTENLFMDLAFQPPELTDLMGMIHEYNLRDVELWCKTDVDAVFLMDDWGSQVSLLISPDMWRDIFKPRYAEYTDIAKKHGKYVFMHSDGHTEAIYPDLIEIGVHALNSQLFCMDIEGLARKYRGQITLYGEIDRQNILPFGTVEDVRKAVQRVRAAWDDGAGGLIAQCEWGLNDPKENIAAVYDAWMETMAPCCG